MRLDYAPRFPADSSSLIRKLTSLFSDIAKTVNKHLDGTENHVYENGYGVVLKDSNGHYWAISVNTAGVVVTTDLGTTRP